VRRNQSPAVGIVSAVSPAQAILAFHMPNNANFQIDSCVQSFATEISNLVCVAALEALEALEATLGRGASPPVRAPLLLRASGALGRPLRCFTEDSWKVLAPCGPRQLPGHAMPHGNPSTWRRRPCERRRRLGSLLGFLIPRTTTRVGASEVWRDPLPPNRVNRLEPCVRRGDAPRNGSCRGRSNCTDGPRRSRVRGRG
jgi:hypothetical protein